MIAGIILIITGTLAFIFNIIGLVATYEIFAFIGHGFWCGVMVSDSVDSLVTKNRAIEWD